MMELQSQDTVQEAEYQNYEASSMGPSSLSSFIQYSALRLENESKTLSRELQNLNAESSELNKTILRLRENISKQQSELEHTKIITQREIVNRERSLEKISDLRGKIESLGNYFTDWYKTMNLMSRSKENLLKIAEDKIIKENEETKLCENLESYYSNILTQCIQTKNNLKATAEKEKDEFENIINQINDFNGDQEFVFKEQLHKLEVCEKEKSVMISMVAPQIEEMETSINNFKHKFDTEKKECKLLQNELHLKLEEEVNKKECIMAKLENTDRVINETNNLLREKDVEIKEFDSKQRELIFEEEENIKIERMELNTMQDLETKSKSQKNKCSILLKIEEENNCLKNQIEEMEQIMQDCDSKIDKITHSLVSNTKESDDLNISIRNLEEEEEKIIKEQVSIREEIEMLQKLLNESNKDHVEKSNEIDEQISRLTQENALVKHSLDTASVALEKAKCAEIMNETEINNLTFYLHKSQETLKETEFKLIRETEKQSILMKAIQEEDNNLAEMIARSIEEYEQGLNDVKNCEGLERHILNSENEIENKKIIIAQSIRELEARYEKEIEENKESMENLRIKYEQEFRSKEKSKTDALFELKEINTWMKENQKLKELREKEIQRLQSNLVKCDNLVKSLEDKLKIVAQVATDGGSQASSKSSLSMLKVQIPDMENQKYSCYPPESSPVAKHFAIDDNIDDIKLSRHPLKDRKSILKKSIPKNQSSCITDDWGF